MHVKQRVNSGNGYRSVYFATSWTFAHGEDRTKQVDCVWTTVRMAAAPYSRRLDFGSVGQQSTNRSLPLHYSFSARIRTLM